MTDMNILDNMKQNNQMMNSGNSFGNWAMQKPGTVDAMRRGGNYDGWNALADIIGAYWDNSPEEAGNDGMGTFGNSGAGSTQAVIGSLGNIGGTLGNAAGNALGGAGSSIGSALGSLGSAAGSAIGEAASKALPEIGKALGGLKLFG